MISQLRAEYRHDALGVATPRPRLSWQWNVGAEPTEAIVRARWADGSESTALMERDAGVLTDWPFRSVLSRERVLVDIRQAGGDRGLWSEALEIEGALFDAADWTEPLVVPSNAAPHEVRPSHLLRAEFELDIVPTRARLHVGGQGVFEVRLNGAGISDEHLAPGWTSYDHRLRTRTHDVLGWLSAGRNTLAIEVADGWFRGNIGFDGGVWDLYGSHVGVIAQLEITDSEGRLATVPLAAAWRSSTGPAVAGLYEGESIDARLVPRGWDRNGFDDSSWVAPELRETRAVAHLLEPAINEPVRPIETLAPRSIDRLANGRVRVDFGQNISGVLRISGLNAPAGHVVRLHHAEVLDGDDLGTRPLRRALSIDSYVAAGGGDESWQPRFTIHGFRYAEIEGWPGELTAANVAAVVMHTDMKRRGWFESSSSLLNQLHENTVWSMRDNFVDLPTDCPQRDERMGWTGDIQVFAPAAEFLYDCDGVIASWLRDVAAEQSDDGAVPNFVPWVPCGFPAEASTAWGDAAVIVPWTMYQRRGDIGVLRAQWPSMTGWVDHLLLRVGPDGVVAGSMELGDWLDPAAPHDRPGNARTDKYLVATAYLVKSSRIVSETALILGDSEAHARYAAIAAAAVEAMQRVYFTDLESLSHAPTAMALGIEFDLVAQELRARLGDLLAVAVREGGFKVQTGFVGTPIICDALVATGHVAEAYSLLLQTECPSWLYPVTMGATTIWERWDSMLPDGSINPGDMTSFNHYALGAVVDFLHRVVAGLAPLEPGYRTMSVRPEPGVGLDSASARHLTPFGEAAVSWTLNGGHFELAVVVPPGTSAVVTLPDLTHTTTRVGPGEHRMACEFVQNLEPRLDTVLAASGGQVL